jgi:hypothetical protein
MKVKAKKIVGLADMLKQVSENVKNDKEDQRSLLLRESENQNKSKMKVQKEKCYVRR